MHKCPPIFMTEEIIIEIDNIPSYYIVSRKKRYTSMNLFYSNTHWSVRKGIVDKAKKTLGQFIDKSIFNVKPSKLRRVIEYHYFSSKKTFDIENRLGFWSKVFLDFAKGTKLIPDDNIQHIGCVCYYSHIHKSKEDKLRIVIYDLPC